MCFSKDCHAIPPNHPKSFLPLDTIYSTCTLSKRSPWAKAPHSKACDTSAMQALCASTSSPWYWDVWIGQHAARPWAICGIPKCSKYSISKYHYTHPTKKKNIHVIYTLKTTTFQLVFCAVSWQAVGFSLGVYYVYLFTDAKKFNIWLPWSVGDDSLIPTSFVGTSHSLQLRQKTRRPRSSSTQCATEMWSQNNNVRNVCMTQSYNN